MKQKKAGAPKDNKNAERWTLEVASEFMEKALVLSKETEVIDGATFPKYDFIGEVAYDLDEDKGVFDYIIEKFPQFKHYKRKLKNNCEVNCFRNIKRENINTAAGIMNLKSNHGWTDRNQTDITTQGDKVTNQFIVANEKQSEEVEKFIQGIKDDE